MVGVLCEQAYSSGEGTCMHEESTSTLRFSLQWRWCHEGGDTHELTKSKPPPCMSMTGPMSFLIMALHSMCQPGRPGPQGDPQVGSPGLADFHRAKSEGLRFLLSRATRSPARLSSYI